MVCGIDRCDVWLIGRMVCGIGVTGGDVVVWMWIDVLGWDV
jgi:hypothetical protein